MTHDPLCPVPTLLERHTGVSVLSCQCNLIARVREDERAAALDAAREAIKALVQNPDAEVDYHRDYTADRTGHMRNPRIWVREAVAAIKELGADR